MSNLATTSQGRAFRWSFLGLLYISQGVGIGFFVDAMPAIGRSWDLSLTQIGMIQALAFPFTLKFLWAPLIDGLSPRRSAGHYRSWLFLLQLSAVAAILAMSGFNPLAGLNPLFLFGGLFMLFAATQDVATDATAVRLLPESDRGIGNGIQVGGYYLGQILGGGVMLICFQQLGWSRAMWAMALMVLAPLPWLIRFREPPSSRASFRPGSWLDFFRRHRAWSWVAVLVFYRTAEQMSLIMFKPYLIDKGLELYEVGLVVGLGGSVAALTGAVLGGWSLTKVGRRWAMSRYGIVQVIFLSLLAATAHFELPLAASIGVSWCVSFVGGMGTAALYTRMMDCCRIEYAGSDFTLQQSLAAVGPIVGAGLSGTLASALGYSGLFATAAGIMSCVVLWIGFGLPRTAGKSSISPAGIR